MNNFWFGDTSIVSQEIAYLSDGVTTEIGVALIIGDTEVVFTMSELRQCLLDLEWEREQG